MHWSLQVNLAVGVGTLALGGGVLVRGPRRARHRLFALLCLALSAWTLGATGGALDPASRGAWRAAMLAGSCAAAPLALHFAFVLARWHGPVRRPVLVAAYGAAALVWLGSSSPRLVPPERWPLVALAVLGTILVAALGLLARSSLTWPDGAERRAMRLLLVAGTIAVAGGLSDFLPRGTTPVPLLGPPAALLFLVVVCGLIVRHRFLDVHVFLTRAILFLGGAAIGGLAIFAVARASGGRYLPIALGTLVVLLCAAAIGRTVTSGARSLVRSQDPVVRVLQDVSRALSGAVGAADVWNAIRDGRAALPGDVSVEVFWATAPGAPYGSRFRAGGATTHDPVDAGHPLPALLAAERLPLTRSYLEREQQEAHGAVRERARAALRYLAATDTDLVVPLRGEGRLLGWFAIGRGFPEHDLTAETATALEAVGHQAVASLARLDLAEQARRREALAAVGELAGGLAHEVRNPVAAIRGAAQALGPAATPEQAREMLEVIDEESARLDRVVGAFLDYARPGSPRREPVELEPLVRQTLRASGVAGRPIDATVVAEAGLPAALGDPDQVRRVFENLARNAWEAATPRARLRVDLRREAHGRVAVRFEDNGPGIPDERLPALFQPFHTTKRGGTGLGLAIVHRIVESHGGEVRVEGRPGRGAAFTVVLPAAADAEGR